MAKPRSAYTRYMIAVAHLEKAAEVLWGKEHNGEEDLMLANGGFAGDWMSQLAGECRKMAEKSREHEQANGGVK